MLVWNYNGKPIIRDTDVFTLRRQGFLRSTSGEDLIDIRLEEESKIIFVKTVIGGAMSYRASKVLVNPKSPLSPREITDIKETITRLIG